ncbi:MAG: TPM domain-containing protein [Casimicrobium sp.]
MIPVRGASDSGSFTLSAVHVVHRALAWDGALPGDADRLGSAQSTVLCLALFANILLLYSAYLPDARRVSQAWRGVSFGALAIAIAPGLLVPDLRSLPAYWLWLAAVALTALGFVWFGRDPVADSMTSTESGIDRGEVPPFVYILLGFTLFWAGINTLERALLTPTEIAASHALNGYVSDRANVLSRDEVARLDRELKDFERATTTQIAVAIYPSVPSGSIDEFTIRAAERMPLGRPDLDNGAILFIFIAERAARLEVGYGLEGALPDVEVRRLLETHLSPALARGDYFGGIDATLKSMIEQLHQRVMGADVVTRWAQRLGGAEPKLIERWLRAVSSIGIGHRILFTFLGAFAVFIVWTPPSMRPGNARKPAARNRSDGSEGFDKVRALWALSTLIPTGIAMIVVGGGMFGGAGALIHW